MRAVHLSAEQFWRKLDMLVTMSARTFQVVAHVSPDSINKVSSEEQQPVLLRWLSCHERSLGKRVRNEKHFDSAPLQCYLPTSSRPAKIFPVASCKSLVAARTNLQRLVPNLIFGCGVSRVMPSRLCVKKSAFIHG
jgi:hypothetical protein